MNKTSWLFIGGTCLILIIFSFFFLRPQIGNIWGTFKETESAKKELEQIAQKKTILTKLSKNGQLKTLRTNASSYIPATANSGELILELTAMAEQNSLKVNQVSLESKQPAKKTDEDTATTTTTTPTNTGTGSSNTQQNTTPGGAQEVGFNIEIKGSFTNLLNFLKSAETSSRLISLQSMTLSQVTESTDLTAKIGGKAYWKKSDDLPKDLANINISQAVIDKFQNLKSYGTPINLTHEEGFGRTDPFANIK